MDRKAPKDDKKQLEILEPIKTYYIIQPAIKYFYLQQGLNFIKSRIYYKNVSESIKDEMLKKLDTQIKGFMLEQIITFDVSKALSNGMYNIFKPSFLIKNKNVGEYDLVIYNKEYCNYYTFEIKHNKNILKNQDKLLINEKITEFMNWKFGDRKIGAVLYNGKHFINENNTPYFNASDFLITINKYKDIEISINHLIKNLVYDKNIFYKGIIYDFESQIEKNQKKYSLTNEKESIKFFNFCKKIIKENPFEFIYINDNNLPITGKKQFPYKDRLDYYMELANIAVNLQPILLEKVNFNSVIFSSLIKEQHYNFYINLCEKAVNKLPLTIKNVNFEYFFNKEKNIDKRKEFIQLWETVINKDTNLIKYLNNSNIKNNDYLNLFFQAYKKDKNIEKYFDNEKLPNHYQNKNELFQKFNKLINKNNTDYEFTKK